MNPIQPVHPDPEPDHVFAPLHVVQRHLATGQFAQLLALDFFTPSLEEALWVSVLHCGDPHYTGRIVTPMREFPQLAVGALVTFTLDQVAAVRGETVSA